MNIRFTASSAAIAIALCSVGPGVAYAQDGPAASASQQPVTAADQSDNRIADIIVTAQRREESLQKVPIAVTAITGEELTKAGAVSTLDLGNVTPGLQMNLQRSTVTPYLRGVGTQNGGVGEEGSIATYVDGVYVSALSAANLELANIERVEVLKGPQGTLFGRNATGGLIQVVTRKPQHEPMVDGEVSYANYDTVTGKGYVTAGLGKSLAVDLAGYYTHQGQGWGENTSGIPGINGIKINYRNEWAVRGSALFEPTDTLSFRLAADYNKRSSDIGNNRVIIPGTISAIGTTFDGAYYGSNSELPRDVDFKQYGVSLVGELDLGGAKLRSTTAYRRVENFTLFDQDSTQVQLVKASLGELTKTFQQEVVLLGKTGRLEYTGGLFYFHAAATFDPFDIVSVIPGVTFNQEGTMKTDSYAAFAQGTYTIADNTHLTAGLRFTRDQRTIQGQRRNAAGVVILDSVNNTFPNKSDFNKLTWRFALDHQFEHVLLYGTVSRGFKSGIYNVTNPFSPAANPETLDAYEVGFKSDLLDRTLRLNLSGFYYNYKDIQLSRIVAGTTIIYNAAKARVYGLDAEAIVAPPVAVGKLEFRSAISLLDSKYTDFSTATYFVPSGVGGNVTLLNQNATGNQLSFAPPVTINLGASYDYPISGSMKLGLNVNYLFNSGFFWEPANRRDIKQRAYNVLNARLNLTGPEDRWRMSLFASNITNERYLSQLTATSLGDAGSYAAPRTYGVSVGFRFGH